MQSATRIILKRRRGEMEGDSRLFMARRFLYPRLEPVWWDFTIIRQPLDFVVTPAMAPFENHGEEMETRQVSSPHGGDHEDNGEDGHKRSAWQILNGGVQRKVKEVTEQNAEKDRRNKRRECAREQQDRDG